MSGPRRADDVSFSERSDAAAPSALEVTGSRSAQVGTMSVRRALPQRQRRTVGAWCFADHAGPMTVATGNGPSVGPHPHMGLQTVTWLLSGELVHHDSLGNEQHIRPGELNLMSAGRGVAHSEESPETARGEYHGIQLWVAQPEATRHGAPAFEHHVKLPTADLGNGTATVLVGTFGAAASPVRRDTDHLGVELDLRRGPTTLPLRLEHEHALVVLSGALDLEGRRVVPGQLAYLGTGREGASVTATDPTKAMLLGGVPFDEPLLMWWNFVARQRDELSEAFRHWNEDDGWFGHVHSRLEPTPVVRPPWLGGA